jgi:putative copper export protein
MKILTLTILTACVVLFFPAPVGNSSCLFGYLTGICFYHSAGHSAAHSQHLLNHYMQHFAIFWWGSIGLVAWLIYQWKKNRKGNHNAS